MQESVPRRAVCSLGPICAPRAGAASDGYPGARGWSWSLRVRPRPRRGWRSVKTRRPPVCKCGPGRRREAVLRAAGARPPAFPPSAAGGQPAKPVLGRRVPARRARPGLRAHARPRARARTPAHTPPSQACGPVAASRSGKQSWDCEVGAAADAWGRGRRGLRRPFLAAGRFRAPHSAAAENQTLAVARAGGAGSALGGASGPRPVRGHRRAGARGEGSLQASPLSLPAPRPARPGG